MNDGQPTLDGRKRAYETTEADFDAELRENGVVPLVPAMAFQGAAAQYIELLQARIAELENEALEPIMGFCLSPVQITFLRKLLRGEECYGELTVQDSFFLLGVDAIRYTDQQTLRITQTGRDYLSKLDGITK